MNDVQAVPGESLLPASTDIFTIGVFVLIALFAIAAIAIIVSGARRKRRRLAAEEVVQDRIEQAEEAPPAPPVARRSEPASPPPPSPAGDPEPSTPTEIAATAPDEVAATNPGADPARAPLTQLKGLGPKVASQLAQQGITTVGDLARLSDDDAARLDAQLGAFAGRMTRDRWLEQARLLAAGDRAGFEAVFGRL